MLLQTTTDDFLRAILLLDSRDKVHVYPSNATAVAASVSKSIYLFTGDRETGVLSGFSLAYSTSTVSILNILLKKNNKILCITMLILYYII